MYCRSVYGFKEKKQLANICSDTLQLFTLISGYKNIQIFTLATDVHTYKEYLFSN